jgi:hypothetical protein
VEPDAGSRPRRRAHRPRPPPAARGGGARPRGWSRRRGAKARPSPSRARASRTRRPRSGEEGRCPRWPRRASRREGPRRGPAPRAGAARRSWPGARHAVRMQGGGQVPARVRGVLAQRHESSVGISRCGPAHRAQPKRADARRGSCAHRATRR